ncbi:hypothetical protein DD924_21060, partial [Staphylococcus pseudintermedius]
MITLAQISAPFLVIGVIAAITYFKLWGYLYKEWFMSVDHKKIGLMYWMITLAQISAPFLVIGVIAAITYFKLWGYLYKEWFMSVDHKKIGLMY